MTSEVCTLITGFQGSGKTLYTICLIEKMRKETGRKVYYSGINGLTLDWEMFGEPGPDSSRPWETDAAKWYELPDGAIIVIDEAQRLMRAGGLQKDPPLYLSKMETLRHRGHQLFLITQEPTLLNIHARKLCGQHLHVMRQFGMQKSVVHQFKGVRENVAKSRKDSVRSSFKYPKEAFNWYRSAELHTVKRALPWKLVAFAVVAPAVVVFSSWRIFWRTPDAPKPGVVAPRAPGAPGQPGVAPKGFDFDSYQPRVSDLPYTAPRYDGLTQPVRVPVIVGCMGWGEPLRSGFCITQQGTRVFPSLAFMSSWFKHHGMFQDFDPGPGVNEVSRKDRPASPLDQMQVARSKP